MTGTVIDPRGAAWDAAGELLALVASTPTPEREPFVGPPELQFRIPALILEGFETSDARIVQDGALQARALPLGLSAMRVNPEFGGHGLAFVAGHIDTLTRVSAAGWTNPLGGTYPAGTFAWQAEGYLNDDTDGRWVANRVNDGSLRYISADLAGVESEIEITEVDADGWPIDGIQRVTAGEIVGATVCNGSAFAGCFIEMVNPPEAAAAEAEQAARAEQPLTASGLMYLVPQVTALDHLNVQILSDGPGCRPCTEAAGLTASAASLRPPKAWFDNPQLDGPTPLTISDEGRVYGHGALWGTCHLGFPGECMTPPRSATDYSLFHLGAVRTAEGIDVAVGGLYSKTGHADLSLSASEAIAWYEQTGLRWADVCTGEDEHGIWFSGYVRPWISEEDIEEARAHPPSGDWRRSGTALEMIGFLSVNVPGYPVPRPRALAASGVPQALVAAGALPAAQLSGQTAPQPVTDLERVTLGLARDLALARLPKRRALRERRAEALNRLRKERSPQ